jgi:hypothetical protein
MGCLVKYLLLLLPKSIGIYSSLLFLYSILQLQKKSTHLIEYKTKSELLHKANMTKIHEQEVVLEEVNDRIAELEGCLQRIQIGEEVIEFRIVGRKQKAKLEEAECSQQIEKEALDDQMVQGILDLLDFVPPTTNLEHAYALDRHVLYLVIGAT